MAFALAAAVAGSLDQDSNIYSPKVASERIYESPELPDLDLERRDRPDGEQEIADAASVDDAADGDEEVGDEEPPHIFDVLQRHLKAYAPPVDKFVEPDTERQQLQVAAAVALRQNVLTPDFEYGLHNIEVDRLKQVSWQGRAAATAPAPSSAAAKPTTELADIAGAKGHPWRLPTMERATTAHAAASTHVAKHARHLSRGEERL